METVHEINVRPALSPFCVLPITSAEPALIGVYAADLLSRWRALRGFRKTLEDDYDKRPWRLMEDIWV